MVCLEPLTLNVLLPGPLQLLTQALWEVVHQGHEEEAVELELHRLHNEVTDALKDLQQGTACMMTGTLKYEDRTSMQLALNQYQQLADAAMLACT